MEPVPVCHSLRQLFSGSTEHAFLAELGLADTKLVDYLSEMLARFVRSDALYAATDRSGRPIQQLAAMAQAAELSDLRGHPRREAFRHVGDFALFWAGLYPESFRERRATLATYCETGRRSYYVASTYVETPDEAKEAPVLRTLAEEFDACVRGLNLVSVGWRAA
ncbi:MAG TPA: hypothetical protein VNC50_18795 [Planctomycetia bacterium]|jgi:hypothetical protein|nr:hypothetical protein [Planctomycetia bacterium]